MLVNYSVRVVIGKYELRSTDRTRWSVHKPVSAADGHLDSESQSWSANHLRLQLSVCIRSVLKRGRFVAEHSNGLVGEGVILRFIGFLVRTESLRHNIGIISGNAAQPMTWDSGICSKYHTNKTPSSE